jgi:hypothetical protein
MKYFLVSLGSLLAGPSGILGQKIGKDICACSPISYEFTFDFDLSCPPVNVEENDAVDRTSCAISPFGDPAVTDLVPVSVQSIDVLELGQGLRILVQERITGTFTNSSTFNYTSLSANASDIVDLTDIPRAIQVNIVGTNKEGQSLLNVYIITFSNNCDAYPVFVEGQSAGWTSFVSDILVILAIFSVNTNLTRLLQTRLEPPIRELCPFGSTMPPTSSPTASATDSPTISPTAETPAATEAPITPTSAPSAETTTRAPVSETNPPTSTPTAIESTEKPSPIGSPTTSPSEFIEAPISMSMSMDYGLAGADLDSIVEEFGLLDRHVPKAKVRMDFPYFIFY